MITIEFMTVHELIEKLSQEDQGAELLMILPEDSYRTIGYLRYYQQDVFEIEKIVGRDSTAQRRLASMVLIIKPLE